jgi:hypothetical protein
MKAYGESDGKAPLKLLHTVLWVSDLHQGFYHNGGVEWTDNYALVIGRTFK